MEYITSNEDKPYFMKLWSQLHICTDRHNTWHAGTCTRAVRQVEIQIVFFLWVVVKTEKNKDRCPQHHYIHKMRFF